jgi:WD40 repeat protein
VALDAPRRGVHGVVFSRDGSILGVAHQNGDVVVHDVASARVRAISLTGAPSTLLLSPDGSRWITCQTWLVRSWDLVIGGPRDQIFVHGRPPCAMRPSGGLLAAERDVANGFTLIDMSSGADVAQVPTASSVDALDFSHDGATLAVSLNSTPAIELWDVGTRTRRAALGARARGVRAVAFSPDDRLLASAGAQPGLQLWDARTGQELPPFAPPLPPFSTPMLCTVFSPNGSLLAACSSDLDVITKKYQGVLRIYDVKTREIWMEQPGHRMETVNAVAFSPDGCLVAFGGTGDLGSTPHSRLELWELRAGCLPCSRR